MFIDSSLPGGRNWYAVGKEVENEKNQEAELLLPLSPEDN